MKENRYDDKTFFDKYGQMARSRLGLAGAGEWTCLRALLPDLTGAQVLDLGCGYGWHCKYAAGQGAARVLGTDLSERMLAEAQTRNPDPRVEYRRAAMEDLDFAPESFDLVFSSLALHYVADLAPLMERIAKWLRPGGHLVFSAEHPVYTCRPEQDWWYDEAGNILHFPVDRYFEEGKRTATFLGEQVVKYHRTLTGWLDPALAAGLTLERVTEPTPPPEMLDIPGMRDELRRPMMLLVRARKPL